MLGKKLTPKISIITAVFNNKDHIAGCINSVKDQTYKDIEHIVVDSGSTDGTTEVLDSYSNDPIKIIHDEKKGLFYSLNNGIGEASGGIIGILHSDDLYADEYTVKKIADAFNDPKVDGVYGDLVYVQRNHPDKVIRSWRSGEFKPSKLKFGWTPPHPTLFLRKEVYQNIGLFDTSFTIASDYDFMLRLLLSGKFSISYIKDVLIKMRTGGLSNRSLACLLRKSHEDFLILKKHGMRLPILTLLSKNFSKLPQFIKSSSRAILL